MSFAQDNGYTPSSFDTIMDAFRQGINTRFNTSYTAETFVGTNWYKFCYAIAQRVQENEVKASEIFAKLQNYIQLTNERIQRPSVSHVGMLEAFANEGFLVSVKNPDDADAGKIFVCALLDDSEPDYPAKKLQVATLLKDFIAAGIVTQGTEIEDITLSNGQSFDFKFYLPNRIPVKIKVTLDISENNFLTVPDDVAIREQVYNQIMARYRLGWDFEPQRYFNLTDAAWAGSVLVEWSDDAGATWHDEIYTATFRDLFTFDQSDIQVVVN